jgi:hypothetical protein
MAKKGGRILSASEIAMKERANGVSKKASTETTNDTPQPTTPTDKIKKMRATARLVKTAAGATVTTGEADHYHPLMTEATLMLPTKFREINQYCFIPGTFVLMADGTEKPIEKVKVGESVISHLGNIKKVVHTFERKYTGKMNVVKTKGNRLPLQMTPNHKVWTIQSKDVLCKDSTDNWYQNCRPQQLSQCKRCNKKELNGFKFVENDKLKHHDCLMDIIPQYTQKTYDWANPDLLRLLGLYAAEGNIIQSKGYVQGICFTFSHQEKDTLAKETADLLEKFTGKRPEIYLYPKKKPEISRINLYSVSFANLISQFISGNCYTKKLASEILELPEQLLLCFLSGMIDGDGHIVKSTDNPNLIEITTASNDLASQIYQMCKICRMVVYRYNKTINRIKINSKHIESLIPLLEGNIINKFSHRTSKQIYDKWNIVKIVDIHSVNYDGNVYNLEVEDDNSYVANGICVSNCRHWFRTDAMVAASINFHSEFAINGMRNLCDDRKVQDYFDEFAFDIIKLPELLSFICLEWYKLGNVMPYGIWDEDEGRWERFITLNPDYVEIEKTLFSDKPILKLDPDEGLKRVVQNKTPKHLYEQLDPQIIAYVSKGQKIPLSQLVIETEDGKFEFPQVTHLARKASQYEVYGTPMLFSAFKILIYKDLLRKAQFAIAKRHWKPIKLVKVGDENHEANNDVLDAIEEAIKYADEDPNSWLVWHHYIQADYIASAGHVMPLQAEYDWIDRELMRALEISDAVLTNQGMTFANASVSLRVMVNKYLRFQKMLTSFIKEFIYKPVAEVQGFYKTNEEGNKELIVPDIEWELMKLQDDAQLKSVLQAMQQKGLISRHTLMTYMGLDYEKERDLIVKEQKDDQIFSRQPKPLGTEPGKPPTGGAPGGGGGAPPPTGGGTPPPGAGGGMAGPPPGGEGTPLGGVPGGTPGGLPPMPPPA